MVKQNNKGLSIYCQNNIIILIIILSINLHLAFSEDYDPSKKIPQTIWQTSKSHILKGKPLEVALQWINQNLEYEYNLLNDFEMDQFIKQNFDQNIYKMFNKYPLGVMKADFWRYCVIYIKGGIYSDIDAQLLKPIREWPYINDGFTQIVIGLEHEDDFCQWTFYAIPKHPLLKHVIDYIYKHFVDMKEEIEINDNFVHKYTGPTIFTEAIYDFMGTSRQEIGKTNVFMDKVKNKDSNVYKKCQQLGITFVYRDFFLNDVVRNLYGSVHFNKGQDDYDRWIDIRDDAIQKKLPSDQIKQKNILELKAEESDIFSLSFKVYQEKYRQCYENQQQNNTFNNHQESNTNNNQNQNQQCQEQLNTQIIENKNLQNQLNSNSILLQQEQQQNRDKQDEIKRLKEEKEQIQKENSNFKNQLDQFQNMNQRINQIEKEKLQIDAQLQSAQNEIKQFEIIIKNQSYLQNQQEKQAQQEQISELKSKINQTSENDQQRQNKIQEIHLMIENARQQQIQQEEQIIKQNFDFQKEIEKNTKIISELKLQITEKDLKYLKLQKNDQIEYNKLVLNEQQVREAQKELEKQLQQLTLGLLASNLLFLIFVIFMKCKLNNRNKKIEEMQSRLNSPIYQQQHNQQIELIESQIFNENKQKQKQKGKQNKNRKIDSEI